MRLITATLRGLAAIGLTSTALVLVAPAASAQNCVPNVPGYAKRLAHGVTEYYEDRSCGTDPHRIQARPAPRPSTPGTGHGCRDYPDGQLCGVGIGQPRPPMSAETHRRLYIAPQPIGTVRVGAPVGIGSGSIGTVTVGAISTVDGGQKKAKVTTNSK